MMGELGKQFCRLAYTFFEHCRNICRTKMVQPAPRRNWHVCLC